MCPYGDDSTGGRNCQEVEAIIFLIQSFTSLYLFKSFSPTLCLFQDDVEWHIKMFNYKKERSLVSMRLVSNCL
jgi:hypothetical protein